MLVRLLKMPQNAFWWFVILPFTLVVGAIFGPLIWLFIWEMYPGMGEEHVHRIEAGDYLPRDDVEIRAKEYFKIDFTAACFLPGYFYMVKNNDSEHFLRNTLNYEGPLPKRFGLKEHRWGLIFVKGSNIYKIIYMVEDMGYPNREILDKLKLTQALTKKEDSVVCSSIKSDQDFIINFNRSKIPYLPKNWYLPISIGIQNKEK